MLMGIVFVVHHQKLVMDEFDLIFGDSDDRPVTAQNVTEFKYLECCIKETMRLYPQLPLISRRLTEDVQTGDFTLLKGLTVLLNNLPQSQCLLRAGIFQTGTFPSRKHACSICIGHKYAMLKLKVILVNLLRRLRFCVSDPSAPLEIPAMELTSKSKSGQCNLIASKRIAS